MCKCRTRREAIVFATSHVKLLRKLGVKLSSIPSEATLCRVEKGVPCEAFANVLTELSELVGDDNGKILEAKVISVDGKCLRGTTMSDGRCPDVVSAFLSRLGVTLATVVCSDKSNEITAIHSLLDKIEIKGKIVTADAIFCQKALADRIVDEHAHFLLQVKGNQKGLLWDIEDRSAKASPLDAHEGVAELAHGRIEVRTCKVYDAKDLIADTTKWRHALRVVEVLCTSERKKDGRKSSDKRFFITDMSIGATEAARLVREHWLVEANHWNMDATFKEDATKRKHATSARNHDTVLRIAMSVIALWRRRRKRLVDRRVGFKESLNLLRSRPIMVKQVLFN